MSYRLPKGGRFIDRDQEIRFTFNGRHLRGFAGDTLASALMAKDQLLMGRSFKYHRPRGVVTSGSEEPNALMGVGRKKRFEPNARATVTALYDRLEAVSQNHWPSLDYDVGVINAKLSRFLPAGFYYKTFLWPRAFWKHVYEPVIRQSAGLGKPPMHRDADRYEHFYAQVDILIVGGGIAGLTAALAAGASGADVLLVEQDAHWGGRAPVDGAEIDGMPAGAWVAHALERLNAMPNVKKRVRTIGAGVYDHGYALLNERVSEHDPNDETPRQRLWKVRARQIITATGSIERPLAFAGNDLPGVMLASAVRDFVVNYGVAPGKNTVVVTNNDDGYRTALALQKAGLGVPVVLDARAQADGPLAEEAQQAGIRVLAGHAISKVSGKNRVKTVHVCTQAGSGSDTEIIEDVDCVAMSGGWSPVVHLWSHAGGKLLWSDRSVHFAPDPKRAPKGASGENFVVTAGAASGALTTKEVLEDAHGAGLVAVGALDKICATEGPVAAPEEVQPIEPIWRMPDQAPYKLRSKAFLDFQNDVKVTDVELAAREGFESVEHAKRYTTLGMATDQGKLSNINGLAVLSGALDKAIPDVGTTTFRPPFTPLTLGAITGEASGDLFQPVRKTPLYDAHMERNPYMEPVGHWRRPYCYFRAGDTKETAVAHEINTTRKSVGVLDASTLGKLIVKGPDAGRLLDMLYTNMMSTLPVGKCRYGLMCSENGFLIDDGVVARIDDETWLCHTTSGGADHIHGVMEEWLQTEWWDWKVWVVNVTEQFGQIGVAGPKARQVLETLGGMDVSRDAMKFMEWKDGTLAGIPVRVFRISFSGELSYEIAVKASQTRALWDKIFAAADGFEISPYGTEALHVMRAEKGFIMIGDETDGTVIPQDLGLHWALSKKKEDYLGKRAQQRSHMTDPNRWKLVGLETTDGSVLPEAVYAVTDDVNANGQKVVEGRVTSTYFSPTLNRGIAMGLVLHGPDRMGETLRFPTLDGDEVIAKIVSPVFHDPEGEAQNV